MNAILSIIHGSDHKGYPIQDKRGQIEWKEPVLKTAQSGNAVKFHRPSRLRITASPYWTRLKHFKFRINNRYLHFAFTK